MKNTNTNKTNAVSKVMSIFVLALLTLSVGVNADGAWIKKVPQLTNYVARNVSDAPQLDATLIHTCENIRAPESRNILTSWLSGRELIISRDGTQKKVTFTCYYRTSVYGSYFWNGQYVKNVDGTFSNFAITSPYYYLDPYQQVLFQLP